MATLNQTPAIKLVLKKRKDVIHVWMFLFLKQW